MMDGARKAPCDTIRAMVVMSSVSTVRRFSVRKPSMARARMGRAESSTSPPSNAGGTASPANMPALRPRLNAGKAMRAVTSTCGGSDAVLASAL